MFFILKHSLVFGAVLGLVLGICSVLPIIDAFLCFLIFFLVGILTIVYLKTKKLVGILTDQDSIIIGAVSGFIAFITSAIIYFPLKSLVNLIFSDAIGYGINIGNTFTTFGYGAFVLIMLVGFTASLSALFNAFTALVTNNIYKKFEKNTASDDDKFTID